MHRPQPLNVLIDFDDDEAVPSNRIFEILRERRHVFVRLDSDESDLVVPEAEIMRNPPLSFMRVVNRLAAAAEEIGGLQVIGPIVWPERGGKRLHISTPVLLLEVVGADVIRWPSSRCEYVVLEEPDAERGVIAGVLYEAWPRTFAEADCG